MVLILWKRFQCVLESEAFVKRQQSSQFWRHDAPTMTIKWHLQYTSSNSIVLRSCKVLVEILHSDASRSHQRKPSYIRNPETFPFESFTVSWCWNSGNINYPHCHTENTNCYRRGSSTGTHKHSHLHTYTIHFPFPLLTCSFHHRQSRCLRQTAGSRTFLHITFPFSPVSYPVISPPHTSCVLSLCLHSVICLFVGKYLDFQQVNVSSAKQSRRRAPAYDVMVWSLQCSAAGSWWKHCLVYRGIMCELDNHMFMCY